MSRLIEMNFRFAVWVTVLGGIGMFAHHAEAADQIRELYRGYGTYVHAGPLVIAVLSAMLWFVWYRDGEGHWPAFCIGTALLVAAIGLVASAAFNDLRYGGLELGLLVYTGASHVLYALLGWRDVSGMLGSEGD